MRPGLAAPEWIEERARFLSEHYGENLLRVRNALLEQEQLLDRAPREEEEVVLWFEHDLFCLINLLYLLSRLAKCRRLSIVWCASPLGAQEDDDLFKQFHSRYPVAPAMLSARTSTGLKRRPGSRYGTSPYRRHSATNSLRFHGSGSE